MYRYVPTGQEQISFDVLVVGHGINVVGYISVYAVNTEPQLSATCLDRPTCLTAFEVQLCLPVFFLKRPC